MRTDDPFCFEKKIKAAASPLPCSLWTQLGGALKERGNLAQLGASLLTALQGLQAVLWALPVPEAAGAAPQVGGLGQKQKKKLKREKCRLCTWEKRTWAVVRMGRRCMQCRVFPMRDPGRWLQPSPFSLPTPPALDAFATWGA